MCGPRVWRARGRGDDSPLRRRRGWLCLHLERERSGEIVISSRVLGKPGTHHMGKARPVLLEVFL
jgi:hypothetical protein